MSQTRSGARYAPQASQTTDGLLLSIIDALRDERAVTIGEMAERMDVPRRAIERAIEQLKHDGYPVICDGQGCRRATTAAELRAAYRAERSRAIKQLVNTRGRLKAIAALEKDEPLTLGLVA